MDVREKILMNIQDLNMLMNDMARRVEQLCTDCPSDWSPTKTELEQGSADMRGKYEDTMDAIGKPEICLPCISAQMFVVP